MSIRSYNSYTLTGKPGALTATQTSVFRGNAPRQAALKACNRGQNLILLRESGTSKIHVFTGDRSQVDKPTDAPPWMPARIWVPNVRKAGLIKFKSLSDVIDGLPAKVVAMLGE